MEIISWHDFERVQLRCGTITSVETFAKAKKPAYKVWVDFGKYLGILQTSAQVTVHYSPQDLIGKQIIGCVNIGEKNIAGFLSQFLLVGFHDEQGGVLLPTMKIKVPNGQKLC